MWYTETNKLGGSSVYFNDDPMFKTNIKTIEAGPFSGPMVVSMRAIPQDKLDMVRAISATFPMAHGAPVHWGGPAAIGIDDLNAPDWAMLRRLGMVRLRFSGRAV